MRLRTRLALSALTGLTAAAVAFWAIGDVRAQAARAEREALARYGGDFVPVCVAMGDVDPGDKIDEANVEVVEWASTLLPSGAMTSLQDAVGRIATSRIPKGAPLSSAYFERTESDAAVPPGKVAISVASNAEHAVGGALSRGELVDVYLSKDARADRLAKAEVIDTSALATGGGDVSWVTLAVEPDAVRELLAASSLGMLWLAVPASDVKAVPEGEGAAPPDAALREGGEPSADELPPVREGADGADGVQAPEGDVEAAPQDAGRL